MPRIGYKHVTTMYLGNGCRCVNVFVRMTGACSDSNRLVDDYVSGVCGPWLVGMMYISLQMCAAKHWNLLSHIDLQASP